MNLLLAVNCAILLVNLLVYAYNRNLAFAFLQSPVDSYFLSPLQRASVLMLDRTFRVLVETLNEANVTYFVFSGTLLGSLRHHGRIPWDDDVDVIINVTDKYRVYDALTKRDLKSLFGLHASSMTEPDHIYQWKFYPMDGHGLFYKNYRSPYIDVFFFYENATHIWNGSPDFRDAEVWPKRLVFPLRPRPFGVLRVPAPCNAEAFLGINFDVATCRSRDFSHSFEVPLPFRSVSVPCDDLAHLYPFVRRTRLDSRKPYVMEELMYQGAKLRQFISELPC